MLPRRGLLALVAILLLPLSAGISPTAAASSSSTASAVITAKAPLPPDRAYPAPLDAPIEYEGMTTCDPVARPGALALRQLLLDTYGETAIGITRACNMDTISEHKEGRAVDWMVDFRNKAEFAEAQAFVNWVTAKGPDGTPAANARRLGIMYIGWADKFWRAYDPGRGWTELKGCFSASMQGASQDTFCHRNHVHFSMTWDGAAGRTSYWDATPVVDKVCPGYRESTSGQTLKPTSSFVPVTPKRIYKSTGCVVGQQRWSGDNRSVSVKVAGRAGVPKSAQAVAVRVTVNDTNAPGYLTASGAPGGFGPRIVSFGQNSDSAGTAILPLSRTGRIWLNTIAGHVGFTVDVLGYFAAERVAAAAVRPGGWYPVDPTAVSPLTIPAGATVALPLAGVAGMPGNGIRGVAVTLTTSAGDGGRLRVLPTANTKATNLVAIGQNENRSAAIFVATGDGTVFLHNKSTAPVTVAATVNGWVAPSAEGGARLRTVSTDLASGVKLGKGKSVVDLTASKVPSGAKAVLLAVTTKGAAKSGGLTVWGPGDRPATRSVDVRAGRATTEMVMTTIGADKVIHFGGGAKGTANVRLVGVIE